MAYKCLNGWNWACSVGCKLLLECKNSQEFPTVKSRFCVIFLSIYQLSVFFFLWQTEKKNLEKPLMGEHLHYFMILLEFKFTPAKRMTHWDGCGNRKLWNTRIDLPLWWEWKKKVAGYNRSSHVVWVIFNVLLAALHADSVDVKLGVSQLSLFPDGRKRFVCEKRSFFSVHIWKFILLASVCVCLSVYIHIHSICIYMYMYEYDLTCLHYAKALAQLRPAKSLFHKV